MKRMAKVPERERARTFSYNSDNMRVIPFCFCYLGFSVFGDFADLESISAWIS